MTVLSEALHSNALITDAIHSKASITDAIHSKTLMSEAIHSKAFRPVRLVIALALVALAAGAFNLAHQASGAPRVAVTVAATRCWATSVVEVTCCHAPPAPKRR